eukprot:scaffold30872_cov32-Prasinocladus_malaysianus.AAC.2
MPLLFASDCYVLNSCNLYQSLVTASVSTTSFAILIRRGSLGCTCNICIKSTKLRSITTSPCIHLNAVTNINCVMAEVRTPRLAFMKSINADGSI